MLYSKELEIKYDVDVVVAGGGTSGCFAAIAAARSGAKTLLIEKNGILGGTMTAGGINFPGLFFAWGKKIISGPCWESIERTVELGGAVLPTITRKPERHWHEQINLNKAIYAHVLDKMCEEGGIEVLLHTMTADVREEEEGLTVIAGGKEGLFGIRTKTVIDATGDADVVHLLGYDFEVSPTQQPSTLVNVLGGYDFSSLDIEKIKAAVEAALEKGELYQELNSGAIVNYLSRYKLENHIPCKACADSYTKGQLEREAREKLVNLVRFLRKLPGLSQLYAANICDEAGVRETRRIVGEKRITAEDYVAAKVFDDAVCYAFYPVDLHVMDGIEQIFLQEDAVPTIPYGALIPKNSKRLFVCGRSISSDNLANSALRVQAPCMAMGQAVGCAAAIAALENKNSADVEFTKLCQALEKINAIIPKKA